MLRTSAVLFLILFTASAPPSGHGSPPSTVQDHVHHEIKAKVIPQKHVIEVLDTITVPPGFPREFSFLLHSGLKPMAESKGVAIHKERSSGHSIADSYRITLAKGVRIFALTYKGIINHPVETVGKEQARGFGQTPGIISADGVYLSGSSHWYPSIDYSLTTFTLQVELPAGWDAVSQGKRTLHVRKEKETFAIWESPEPQDEIFLVAATFTGYTRTSDGIEAMVFLRTSDKALAEKYLDATVNYISMYEKLIGPYPYGKFALVENFWETGFGMPSFTVLGPKIIRFPFIINSSYPHEILHNWWGNSVFPDYAKGNWSEGLTAYLSDHLIKEQEGSGAEFRQTTLQKYADYVLSGRDFPLTEFRSRHSSSSEAIGYGKSLMFFHMLRLELKDETFIKGLRDFYKEKKFRFSTFDDLRKSFEKVSGRNLGAEFDQWVKRTGAPEIRTSGAKVETGKDSFVLSLMIEQAHSGDIYRLSVPLAVTMEKTEKAFQTMVLIESRGQEVTLRLPSRPLRIDIDPEFDLFRRLDRSEIPPAISQTLGAKKMLIILPSSANPVITHAYRNLARDLGNEGPDTVEIKPDNEVKNLPSDRAVVILGWENFFLRDAAAAFSKYDVLFDPDTVRIGKAEIPRKGHSVVMAGRSPKSADMGVLFIASDSAGALPGLGRKLPHYHKYSYLGFEGEEPENIAKGRWPVTGSPMTIFFPGSDGRISKVEMGKLAPRGPLVAPPAVFSAEEMMYIVRFLSSDEMRGRGLGTEELERAAKFIAGKFREAGLEPGGEGSYYQIWQDPELNLTMKNVIGVLPGGKKEFAGQSIVVGAHYDHLGLGWPDVREGNIGKVHPGADDNASGVSVLLELAGVLAKSGSDRTVIFIAFTGEEAGKKGSRHYVSHARTYPLGKCIGMLNLDTVGRLGNNKLLILGGASATEWEHIFRGTSFLTGVDMEMVSEDLDSSDQVSFENAGVPAVQLFTGPHSDYHRPTDTADKIDPEGLIKVSSVAKEVIERLSSGKTSLTFVTRMEKGQAMKVERKVSLGTIPDFGFKGRGVRLSGVVPGSPAEASGMREGDVIIRIGLREVNGLKDLSDILKALSAGSRLKITFLRAEKEITVEAEARGK